MIVTQPTVRRDDVARILAEVNAASPHQQRPALVVLVGLPASGKSRVAGELRERTGAVVFESDALRRFLFPQRTYSARESQQLFAAIHAAIDELLSEGTTVVLDATNLAEAERAPLREMAARWDAKLVFVRVTAPDSLIRRRLASRSVHDIDGSEADVRVYERMRSRVEELRQPHHIVDTSQEIGPAMAIIARELGVKERAS